MQKKGPLVYSPPGGEGACVFRREIFASFFSSLGGGVTKTRIGYFSGMPECIYVIPFFFNIEKNGHFLTFFGKFPSTQGGAPAQLFSIFRKIGFFRCLRFEFSAEIWKKGHFFRKNFRGKNFPKFPENFRTFFVIF